VRAGAVRAGGVAGLDLMGTTVASGCDSGAGASGSVDTRPACGQRERGRDPAC
jgi:hypothetical protein